VTIDHEHGVEDDNDDKDGRPPKSDHNNATTTRHGNGTATTSAGSGTSGAVHSGSTARGSVHRIRTGRCRRPPPAPPMTRPAMVRRAAPVRSLSLCAAALPVAFRIRGVSWHGGTVGRRLRWLGHENLGRRYAGITGDPARGFWRTASYPVSLVLSLLVVSASCAPAAARGAEWIARWSRDSGARRRNQHFQSGELVNITVPNKSSSAFEGETSSSALTRGHESSHLPTSFDIAMGNTIQAGRSSLGQWQLL